MSNFEILGFTAGALSAITFLPQVIKTWKRKSSGDISLSMVICLVVSVIIWFIYGILIKNAPVIFTNSIILVLSSLLLYLKLRYK